MTAGRGDDAIESWGDMVDADNSGVVVTAVVVVLIGEGYCLAVDRGSGRCCICCISGICNGQMVLVMTCSAPGSAGMTGSPCTFDMGPGGTTVEWIGVC